MVRILPNLSQNVGCVIPSYVPQILLDIYNDTQETVLYVASSSTEMKELEAIFPFFNMQNVSILYFDGWDCLPYDRVSPSAHIVARRCSVLSQLLLKQKHIILTSVDALTQRVIPRHILKGRVLSLKVGSTIDLQDVKLFLVNNGFRHTQTVREQGEFATRGGIVDIFPSYYEHPVRIDLFDTEIETIRTFDVMSQKSLHAVDNCILYPATEVLITPDTIASFRKLYKKQFGANVHTDNLYESISEGIPYQGYEHWISMFYGQLETIFEYLPITSTIVFANDTQRALHNRNEDISTYYQTRLEQYDMADTDNPYRPVPVEDTYLNRDCLMRYLHNRTVLHCHQSQHPQGENMPIRTSPNFTSTRIQGDNVWQKCKSYTINTPKKVMIACNSFGEMERIRANLIDLGFKVYDIESFENIQNIQGIGVGILPIKNGFETDGVVVVSQQDILGEKTLKNSRRRPNANFITEHSSMDIGDLVVHETAGIGRYEGLETLKINEALHDCVRISFDGGDSIFVPVENIDVLSRYGQENESVQLDRLGGMAWQARKKRLQNKIGQMADALIEIASKRALKKGDAFPPPQGIYDEFSESFPYVPTDDQAHAIDDVLSDMSGGNPMDRLICGDVGFGKTEVAMRGIFCAIMNGAQVALVAPTTLLVRQHYNTLVQRFKGLPVQIGQISRLTSIKNNNMVKQKLADGTLDIVVGTHGLFARTVQFKNLGLAVIDEEQSFGVKQKESLKRTKENVHMLSLSATPIPRTLQTALTGVRDMSIIASPPIDRLPIRTFNMPYDSMVIKEALQRERWRSGQSYYVCPRISDLNEVYKKLSVLVPDLRIAIAHGGVPAKALDTIMDDFLNGKYDVLLATNIIESGIDVKTANTMIIHRADMFGLSQLYQLRGRIGRSNTQAYCYLTTNTHKILTDNAKKRLQVISSLDTLGCGFNIASHDLDIRGAGNLLGAEQSGHVREVGVELYQRMLEQAILQRQKRGHLDSDIQEIDTFSPQISIDVSIYIPEAYISDLSERLSIYRRLGRVETSEECDDIITEMADRFGKIPDEVYNLLNIVRLKILCRQAGVDRVDIGKKGVVIGFYKDTFSQPESLISYITNSHGTVKLRPDQKIVAIKAWHTIQDCIQGTGTILRTLAQMVENADEA